VLLLRGYGCLPLNHLHLHGARHEQLCSVLAARVRLVTADLLLLLELLLLLVVLLVVWASCGRRMLDLLLVLLLLVISDPRGRRGDHLLPATRLVASATALAASRLGRVLVVRVQLVDVERVAPLVHVRVVGLRRLVLPITDQVAVYLDRLRAIPLLRVQLPPMAHVNRLDEQSALLVMSDVPLLRNDGLAGRVEPEVGLVHQLLVERGVHPVVEVLPD